MIALTGLFTGLSLILPIGAQNAFVLRVGLTKRHVASVVAVCALSDIVLITAGVAGLGALVARHETLLTGIRWVGALYLAALGVRSLWSARQPGALTPADGAVPSGRKAVSTAMAITWLNPHVYLDTVLMLGSIAATYGVLGRWWFGLGAMSASVIWFVALAFGAGALARYVARPGTWRVIDAVIGLTMLVLAAKLVLG